MRAKSTTNRCKCFFFIWGLTRTIPLMKSNERLYTFSVRCFTHHTPGQFHIHMMYLYEFTFRIIMAQSALYLNTVSRFHFFAVSTSTLYDFHDIVLFVCVCSFLSLSLWVFFSSLKISRSSKK